MLWLKKNARFVGYTIHNGEVTPEWRCPNKSCGLVVHEGSVLCPHCSQRLRFDISSGLSK